MRQICKYFFITILFFLLVGCGTENSIDLGPKKEVVSYSKKAYAVKGFSSLVFESDFSNVEVYCQDYDEIKFEITKKIRGIGEKSELEKKLNDFSVETSDTDNKVSFKSSYKGNIKGVADKTVDVKIFVPKVMDSVSLKLNTGTIKILDNVKCALKTELKMVNVDISSFEGKLKFIADMGNIRINGGRIYKDSYIKIGEGNVNIKAEFYNEGSSHFETGMGNIELLLPSDSKLNFENIGDVEINEFKEAPGAGKLQLNTSMGKIAIRKY
ncbi:MAG: hypothetical protein Q8942_01190 [Bacillota bacterium]|nr:hypothetical protein [Bacillota bacterium]